SAYPEAARRIAIEGHVVGNHSNFHAPLTLLSENGFQVDVRESERRIHEATGVDPRPWFRCPFGEGASRPEIVEQLGRLGARTTDGPAAIRAAVLAVDGGISKADALLLDRSGTLLGAARQVAPSSVGGVNGSVDALRHVIGAAARNAGFDPAARPIADVGVY